MKQANLGISPKVLALFLGLFLSVSAFAQITVKGLVKDDLGEPLPGANVAIKGKGNAAVTDFNGKFQLSCAKGATLVISYIGFNAKEVTAAPSVVVTMSEDAKMLQEAVVIGYGTAKKSDLTGSVAVVKPDEENKGFVTSAQDLMQGKIAGVSVINNGGEPGAGATIRVRGGASLNASSDPLIVIDGLALDNNGVQGVSNPLALVNPADIESFSVLKDASATAIYGSRGSNGVIIITTKKGKAGSKVKVGYTGNVSVSTLSQKMDVMTGDEYRDFIKNYYGQNTYDELTQKGWLGDANTDWQDEVYRNGVSTEHNITLQGGLKHMPYRVSLGYAGIRGTIKTSENKRTNVGVSLNPSLANDHLKINLNGKFLYNERTLANTAVVGTAVAMNPTVPVKAPGFDSFGGYWAWAQASNYSDSREGLQGLNSNGTKNPVAMLDLRRDLGAAKQFVGNAEFDYAIHKFEDLHLHANLGADYSKGKSDVLESPMSPNNYYYGYQGWYSKEKYNLQANTYAQYGHNWKEKHDFNVMAGYEWQHFHNETAQDEGGLYPLTYLGVDANGNSLAGTHYTNWTTVPGAGENYLVSFFGRTNYTLLGRYSATVTVRRDGSSRFHKDHRWGTFPSAALAWRINEEKFMQNCSNVSQLKLRLGYGQTGQQEGISDWYYMPTYNVGTTNDSKYPLAGDGTLYRPNVYNPDLTWETTTTYNAALDLGLWNNRLTASVDFYLKRTTDLLNTVYVSAGSNFRNMMTGNIGSMENKGVELQIGYTAVDKKNWTWDLGFNATYNHSEITDITVNSDGTPVATGGISAGTGGFCQAHAKGHAPSSFYIYQQVYGDDGQPIEGAYVDRDGNGIINESDKYFYKSPNAPWMFGLSSKLRYKNWDLGFNLRASVGNYVYNDTEAGWSNVSTVYDSSLAYLSNRPTYELPKSWKTWDNALSDYFIHNASFLKCDNITLGYSFPSWTRHKISGRIFASVSNVFTVTKYNGLDPEVFGGIDNNMYPRPRTYQVGVSLNF